MRIARLKKAGYRVFGLTNWSGETFPLVRHKFAVLDLLEDIVVSGNEKIVKPDPRLYQILLDRNTLVPDECLFIDDSKKNTDAAEGVGMHSLLFVDAGRLESDLKALGLDF